MRKTTNRVTVKDADQGIVEAVFATLDVVDADGDVILPGAIPDGSPVVISAYGHRSWDGALPVGKGTIHEEGNEAVMRGEFFLDTVHGRDTWATVRELSESGLQEWSFSLEDITRRPGEIDGVPVSFIERIGRVKEVSPVLVGAGVNTRTLTVKDGLSFVQHVETVVADVDELIGRAREIVALRAAKGKQISAVSADLLTNLGSRLEALKELLSEPEPIDLAHELVRFVQMQQGV